MPLSSAKGMVGEASYGKSWLAWNNRHDWKEGGAFRDPCQGRANCQRSFTTRWELVLPWEPRGRPPEALAQATAFLEIIKSETGRCPHGTPSRDRRWARRPTWS